jgi:hypothetical protein
MALRHLRARILPPLVLLLAIVACVTHVCVFPHAAYASAGAEHGERTGSHTTDSNHRGSCDATISSSTGAGPVAQPSSGATSQFTVVWRPANVLLACVLAPALVSAEPAPLFLLHSSLLI